MESIKLLMNEIQKIDTQHVIEYNKRAKEEHKLHLEMGPSPFEGDIENAQLFYYLRIQDTIKTQTLVIIILKSTAGRSLEFMKRLLRA